MNFAPLQRDVRPDQEPRKVIFRDVHQFAATQTAVARDRSASLAAQGIPPDCVRFYWLAREVLGGHNGWWPIAKIAARIKWFTGLYGTDDAAFRAWHYWIAGIHRIGQHDHMKPCHRHKLPEIDAHFEALF